ncbi:MAG: hypothetical protein A2161_11185, partial [Candidatus Schekmanbacteria bacterium RBG_13_48_7]
ADVKTQEILVALFGEIQKLVESQREFNAKLVRSINSFFDFFSNILGAQKTFNAETVRFINEYIGIEDPESKNIFVQERKLLNDRLEAFLQVLGRRFQSSELKTHREIKNLSELIMNFFTVLDQQWNGQLPGTRVESAVPRKKIEDVEYAFFEDIWRGAIHDVKKKQLQYLKYFKDKKNILDFGCGRGEFLELLTEANFNAFGVEENEEMASICKEKQLNVVCQNGVVYLHRISDNFLGAIFISHVIEHLSYREIMGLINLCFRKLEKDGIVILETINPCNYKAFFHSYIKDFTHKTPIHPDTLQFVLEMNGFKIVDILKLSEIEESEKLRKMDVQSGGLNELNKDNYNLNIERLNKLLFGNQDYAIIASK